MASVPFGERFTGHAATAAQCHVVKAVLPDNGGERRPTLIDAHLLPKGKSR
jgi:hypothetical protein